MTSVSWPCAEIGPIDYGVPFEAALVRVLKALHHRARDFPRPHRTIIRGMRHIELTPAGATEVLAFARDYVAAMQAGEDALRYWRERGSAGSRLFGVLVAVPDHPCLIDSGHYVCEGGRRYFKLMEDTDPYRELGTPGYSEQRHVAGVALALSNAVLHYAHHFYNQSAYEDFIGQQALESYRGGNDAPRIRYFGHPVLFDVALSQIAFGAHIGTAFVGCYHDGSWSSVDVSAGRFHGIDIGMAFQAYKNSWRDYHGVEEIAGETLFDLLVEQAQPSYHRLAAEPLLSALGPEPSDICPCCEEGSVAAEV